MPEVLDADRAVQAAIRARKVAENHFVYEATNDPDEIMRSMKSYDPMHTAVLLQTPDQAGLEVIVLGTLAEQHAHYAETRALAHMTGLPDVFTSVGSEWYGFVHFVMGVNPLGTDDLIPLEVIGLLPVTPDEDTVAGELGWARTAEAKRGNGDAPPFGRAEILHAHERWLAALRDGDTARLSSCYAPAAVGAVRGYPTADHVEFHDRDEAAATYDALLGRHRSREVEVVLRIVEDWFLLTELRWTVTDTDQTVSTFRTAELFLVGQDDAILGHLGYGTDPVTQ
jgi:hypothetical protein